RPGPDDNADLRYVGVMKTMDGAGNPILNFGIATFGESQTAHPADAEFDIYIDTDRDGNPDFVLFNWDAGSAGATGATDAFYSVLANLSTGDAFVERRINGLSPGTRDTVTYNTSAMAISAFAADLGTLGEFDWQVVSFNRALGMVDLSDVHTWNFATPGLSTPGAGGTYARAPMYEDLPGNMIAMGYNRDALNAHGSMGLLLLHHHNGLPTRAQAVNVKGKKFGQ